LNISEGGQGPDKYSSAGEQVSTFISHIFHPDMKSCDVIQKVKLLSGYSNKNFSSFREMSISLLKKNNRRMDSKKANV
jgi:hypothetical protein